MAKEKKQTPRSMSKTPRKSKRKMSESSTGTKDNDNATPRAIVSPPRRVAPRISSPAASSLQRILVGGPLLGKKPQSISGGNKLVGWDTFEPIITAEISSESGKKPERYILLPHARHIAVLSYKTGIKVASLIPNASEQDEDVLIASVCLARYQRNPSETTIQDVLDRMDVDDDTAESPAVGTPQMLEEIVVMVGCHDGSIREFSLKDMADGSNESTENRPYQILGPTFHPRRVIKFEENNDPIMHLTIPYLSTLVREDGILAYVAMRIGIDSKSDRKKSSTVAVEVKRFLIPHFDGTTEVLLSNEEGNVTRISSIEKLTCKLVPSKQGSLQSTLPFRLLSATKPALTELSQQRQDIAVFVVLACMNRVSVYYEQLDSADTWEPVHLEMPVGNPLTTIDIALNKIDLTCGHYRGNIRVMNGALESVEKYHLALFKAKDLGRKPPHPQSQIISSRVHWHALPVSSLVYDSMSYAMDPLLYSGGDECVLVTWQIAQGKDRPVDVHPRLALGSIVHVASSDRCDNNAADGILVYCDDNTLQLLTSHNKSQVWKVQGLAGVADDESVTSSKGVSLEIDPRSAGSKESQIVITGLAQAPGYIHWFNPARERLNSSLEIAPFNRISRNEPEDSPLPSPTVTCHAFSKNGNDLITIDEHPTENVMVGYSEDTGKTDHGLVSTIRFWAFNNAYSAKAANAPYDQLASMTFPHGPKNRISAIAISNDGSTACSVSSSEKAFRLWHKISPKRPKAVQQASEKQAHTWICRCKVTVPSGFANFSTNEKGVAFSDDGSILAISFGHSITLWDADEARLLTSFTHNFGRSSIDKVSFVNPGLHKDLLLVQSKGGVSLRSPYGIFGNSESFDAWDYDVSGDKSFITSSELVYSHSCIAVAVYFPKKDKSRIIILGAEKGGVESFQLPKDIDGRIDALCSTGKREKRSNWSTDAAKNRISSLNLYALSSAGEMFQITESTTKQQLSFISGSDMTSASHFGPRLDMISPTGGHQKRQRTFTDTMGIAGPKKMALDVFGFGSSETGSTQPSTVELPSLSGNFVRSFVSRNLSRSA
jgi:NET1-associated nuclear protein 1 (U3 small nucleolar RNA-associated protein 17)